MIQTSLFEIPKARPDTRRIAHDKVRPAKKRLHIQLIKDFAEREFNADQFAAANNLSVLSVRPRVSEIAKSGLIYRTRYGLTIDGNPQNVYALYPFYKERLETLMARFGIDRAAEELLAEHGLK